MAMKIEIKSRFTGQAIFTHECENNSILITIKAAIKAGAYLSGADLSGIDFSGTYLSGTYLSWANLSGTYLSWANLSGADLSGIDLSGTYLSWADLSGANLSGANLSGANLSGADLSGADLSGANLSWANLSGAYLSGADLSGAYLSDKDNHISDIKQIGNLGSRGGFTIAFKCKTAIIINCGCFWGNIEQFKEKVINTHGDNIFAKHYLFAIEFFLNIWKEEI